MFGLFANELRERLFDELMPDRIEPTLPSFDEIVQIAKETLSMHLIEALSVTELQKPRKELTADVDARVRIQRAKLDMVRENAIFVSSIVH